MARTLRESPPSSSVARLLDPGAVERALAPAHGSLRVAHSDLKIESREPAATARERPIKREILLTRETDVALDELVQIFRDATGARLTTSHVVRALLRGIKHTIPSLRRAAQQVGRVRLPSNAPAHQAERDAFEQRLAEAFMEVVRGPRD